MLKHTVYASHMTCSLYLCVIIWCAQIESAGG